MKPVYMIDHPWFSVDPIFCQMNFQTSKSSFNGRPRCKTILTYWRKGGLWEIIDHQYLLLQTILTSMDHQYPPMTIPKCLKNGGLAHPAEKHFGDSSGMHGSRKKHRSWAVNAKPSRSPPEVRAKRFAPQNRKSFDSFYHWSRVALKWYAWSLLLRPGKVAYKNN